MKKLLLLLIGTLAIAGATPAVSQSDPTATVNVAILETGFQPSSVVIRAGDTVTWRNADTEPHRVVSDTGAFPSSPVLQSGQTYSHRFGISSAYSYRDGIDSSNKKTGVVHVRGGGVTIALTRLFAVYRNPVQVIGSVGNARPGQQVTINMTRYGGQQLTRVVTTDAEGTYSLVDRPPIRTEYQASWANGESTRAPFVNVRPLVIFRVLSHQANRFYVKVAAQRSYRGRFVLLQRRTNSGSWFTTKRVRLNQRGEARFRGNFPRGTTQARMWINRAPGYIPGFSVTKTVSR